MDAKTLRSKYLNFFASKDHAVIKSASVVPENDPTVLFTTAGMHPLVPYLMGQSHPAGTRLTDAQKCIRTGDIEEVGDDTHLTFFEMLGNWSLGDYFKKESITWSYEFLTSELGLPASHIAVSVFAGDDDAERDEEAAEMWREVSGGALEGRIDYLPKKNNWWGPAGETGPCGPDTEIFYWIGEGEPPATIEAGDLDRDGIGWVEIWNNVFMQYDKQKDGTFQPLSQKNVDTGMGLERVVTVLQGKSSVYDTDVFTGILAEIKNLAKEYNEKSARIIADHVRASVIILGDGVLPAKEGQGYVLRRLIRLAIRHGKKMGIEDKFLKKIGEKVVESLGEAYTEITNPKVLDELELEENAFARTLNDGMKQFQKLLPNLEKNPKREISGKISFKLYDTYGFPLELTQDLAKEHNFTVDTKGFEEAKQKHAELSRTASAGAFKGGLQDDSEATTEYHTCAHLLLSALQKVVNTEISQRGANITSERLRFDFDAEKPLTDEQKSEIENLINSWIEQDIPVVCEEMPLEKAKEIGAHGQFWDKYGDVVKVYTVEGASTEICGGPHVEKTGGMGKFKIKSEKSSSRGVRRIKAILEK